MEFTYILSRWSDVEKRKKIIGGFVNLDIAKKMAEHVEYDYLSFGYMLVEGPEGRFILGEDGKSSRWYGPGEAALVYDPEKGAPCVVNEIE